MAAEAGQLVPASVLAHVDAQTAAAGGGNAPAAAGHGAADVAAAVAKAAALVATMNQITGAKGYMAVAVMMRNTDSSITLVVQAIKNDLTSTQDAIQCLALCAIANIGGRELA